LQTLLKLIICLSSTMNHSSVVAEFSDLDAGKTGVSTSKSESKRFSRRLGVTILKTNVARKAKLERNHHVHLLACCPRSSAHFTFEDGQRSKGVWIPVVAHLVRHADDHTQDRSSFSAGIQSSKIFTLSIDSQCLHRKSLPSKGVWSMLIESLNLWLHVPQKPIQITNAIVHLLHDASLILDASRECTHSNFRF
jgi:hypothetical protein